MSLENGVCVYVQVVKKERENPPKQYLTINPYSPLIWESIKDDTNFAFDSSTINHFKDFTQQCIDSIKNKKDIVNFYLIFNESHHFLDNVYLCHLEIPRRKQEDI